MIHSARPTVSPVANIVFTLSCLDRSWKVGTDDMCKNNDHYQPWLGRPRGSIRITRTDTVFLSAGCQHSSFFSYSARLLWFYSLLSGRKFVAWQKHCFLFVCFIYILWQNIQYWIILFNILFVLCSEVRPKQVVWELAMVVTSPDSMGSMFFILLKGSPKPLWGRATYHLNAGATPLHAL